VRLFFNIDSDVRITNGSTHQAYGGAGAHPDGVICVRLGVEFESSND
jgi:hypothetical protein